MKKTLGSKIDNLLVNLVSLGIEPTLTRESYGYIIEAGFRGDNLPLACGVSSIVVDHQPLTLRSTFYQTVSAGMKPSTDMTHYNAVGRVLKRLRRSGVLPYSWIVDSMRNTFKPPSWSGLSDYIEQFQDTYRKDFWSQLPNYVHVISEKDAIAGTLQPITAKYDVPLSPLRGFVSDSFVYSIAETWNRIEKPIHVAYFGDFDPSGMIIESDCIRRLRQLCKRDFTWTRLGVDLQQINDYGLLPLAPKAKDKRTKRFIEKYGTKCAEVDAIPANKLRGMLEEFITDLIPQMEWQGLLHIESIERDTFQKTLGSLKSQMESELTQEMNRQAQRLKG